jgi:hypothetical protein
MRNPGDFDPDLARQKVALFTAISEKDLKGRCFEADVMPGNQ